MNLVTCDHLPRLAGALVGLGLAATALGQESPAQLDRPEDVIVVTAQFREQAAAEVPISVSSFDQSFLDEVGLDQLDDLSAFVPGLQIQEQSVNNPGFVIRGITSDDGSSAIEPRVSVFQNGVSISRSRGSYVPLFDLERVEVMKGPQGTLFGRSAQIGAVHLVTQKPGNEWASSARLELGNFAYRKFDGMVNLPLGTSDSAIRLAATYRSRDGFIDNNIGGELNGTDTRALRASWRTLFGERSHFDLIFNYVEDDAPGTSFKSGIIPALGGDTDPHSPASLNAFGGLLGGRALGTKRDIFDLTAIVNWQPSSLWTINSTTAWREFDSFEAFDPDGSAFDLFFFGEDADGEQWSSELRFTFQPDDRLTAFFGAGFFTEEGSQRVPLGLDGAVVGALLNSIAATGPIVDGQATLFGDPGLAQLFLLGDPALLAGALGAGGVPTGLFQQEQFTNFADNQSYDVFADVSYALTDRLTATAGLRYTRDRKETLFSSGVEVDNPFLGNLLVPDINTPVSSDDDPSVGRNFDGWAWRANLNFELSANQFVYGNYARGRRPDVIEDVAGQFNPALGVPVAFERVPEEIVDSYEIGYKMLFMDGRSQFDVAAFYYDYENFQTTISVDAGPGLPPDLQLINAGTASSRGLETQLSLNLNEGLDLYASYAYNRSRFDKTDDQGNPLIFGGNRFRLSPDHTAGLALRASRAMNGGRLYFTPSVTYQSKVFFQDDNQGRYAVVLPTTGQALFEVPAISEGGYSLFNVRAGYEFSQGQFAIEAFVNNLTDRSFIIDAGNTGATFNIPTFIAGAPRTYGLAVRAVY